jgi:hypothetical protein
LPKEGTFPRAIVLPPYSCPDFQLGRATVFFSDGCGLVSGQMSYALYALDGGHGLYRESAVSTIPEAEAAATDWLTSDAAILRVVLLDAVGGRIIRDWTRPEGVTS